VERFEGEGGREGDGENGVRSQERGTIFFAPSQKSGVLVLTF